MSVLLVKYAEFQLKLAEIYHNTDRNFQARVSEFDFVNGFPVIWGSHTAQMVERPEDFELDDEVFSRVQEAFCEVYR